jgi:hypothetical protein
VRYFSFDCGARAEARSALRQGLARYVGCTDQ